MQKLGKTALNIESKASCLSGHAQERRGPSLGMFSALSTPTQLGHQSLPLCFKSTTVYQDLEVSYSNCVLYMGNIADVQ